MKKIIITLTLAALLSACSSKAPTPQQPSENPQKQYSKEEMMQMWEKAGMPGENHKRITALAGKWKTEVTTWMPGSDKPLKSNGKAIVTSIFGGRFIEEKYSGTFHGKPFEGRGIFGYDNVKNEFTSVWIDNTGTGIMTSTGTFNNDTISWSGDYTCPITKQSKHSNSITKIISDKEHVFEMWEKNEEGKDIKIFEIKYTRIGK